MRAIQDETYKQFSDWLLRIGTGDEPYDDLDQVTLPQNIVTDSLQDMINFVYPPIQPGNQHVMRDPFYMSQRCCLTPLNENSHHITYLILQQLDTPVHTYLSTDRVVTDNPEEAAAYPMEFLNAQTPSGLPKHKLELKLYTFHLFPISLHISASVLLSMLFCVNYLISFNDIQFFSADDSTHVTTKLPVHYLLQLHQHIFSVRTNIQFFYIPIFTLLCTQFLCIYMLGWCYRHIAEKQ